MTIIPQNDRDGQMLCTVIENFLSIFHVGKLLRKCNASKEKGVPVMKIFRYMIGNVFNARSMYMQIRTDSYREDFSKNTYYRFLNSVRTNWFRFTTLLSAAVAGDFMQRLTSEERKDVFIIDDTLFSRSGYKKTDMVIRVFDHTEMKYRKGFRLLTLGWSDGNSFLPINFSLLSSNKESNQLGVMELGDGRTIAGRRRSMALRKATDVMLELLDAAMKAGHQAKYVLFETWFAESSPDRCDQGYGPRHHRNGEEEFQDHIRIRRQAHEFQADLQAVEETQRTQPLPSVGGDPCGSDVPDSEVGVPGHRRTA